MLVGSFLHRGIAMTTETDAHDVQIRVTPAETPSADPAVGRGRHADSSPNGERPAAETVSPQLQGAPVDATVKMGDGQRVFIGLGLLLFSALVLAHLVWAWSIATRLVPPDAPAIRVHWLGV